LSARNKKKEGSHKTVSPPKTQTREIQLIATAATWNRFNEDGTIFTISRPAASTTTSEFTTTAPAL
jgi:hypothetical protein